MITTRDVLEIAWEYNIIKHQVSDQVAELEKEQIRLGVGMTKSGGSANLSERLLEIAIDKHWDCGLADVLRCGI